MNLISINNRELPMDESVDEFRVIQFIGGRWGFMKRTIKGWTLMVVGGTIPHFATEEDATNWILR